MLSVRKKAGGGEIQVLTKNNVEWRSLGINTGKEKKNKQTVDSTDVRFNTLLYSKSFYNISI